MESFQLRSGLSFLNLYSESGYFSTIVGLILGKNGINHNIVFEKDQIKNAKGYISRFVANSIDFESFVRLKNEGGSQSELSSN